MAQHTPRLDEETQATEPGVDAADSGLMRGSISAADASNAHLDRDIDVVDADPPSGRDHHGTIPDDIVEIIDELYSIRGSDRDSAASRRSLEIIEEGIPARAEHKAKKPRRVAETVERYPAYTSTDGRVVDDDIIEVIEDHADTAREQKSRTRIMLPIRFVHHQAFDELDLKVTKDFRDRVQLEARGEVDLDVGFGTKEHIDRIVALSEKHWGERGESEPLHTRFAVLICRKIPLALRQKALPPTTEKHCPQTTMTTPARRSGAYQVTTTIPPATHAPQKATRSSAPYNLSRSSPDPPRTRTHTLAVSLRPSCWYIAGL